MFPRWFLARILCLSINGGLILRASLTVISYIPSEIENLYIKHVAAGNISGVRTLLSDGLMHVNAVSNLGWTPLPYAISNAQLEISELLLSAGADPHAAGADGMSGIDFARIIEFGSSSISRWSPDFKRKLLQLFPSETSELPILHQIIFGISEKPLGEYLAQCNGALNNSRVWGSTALEWAVRRCDETALIHCLQYVRDRVLRKSLAESLLTSVRNASCLEVLLATGADINSRAGSRHETILYLSLVSGYDYRHLDLISQCLAAGANPNLPDNLGNTPFMMCAFGDRDRLMALMLRHGASVNIATGPTKKRPVHFALWLNAHNCLKLLLANGLDCSLDVRRGTTILHFCAEHSNMETMEILINASLQGVDIGAKNPKGLTAREILRAREDYSPELNEAFEALVFSIRPGNRNAGQGSSQLDGQDMDRRLSHYIPGSWPAPESGDDGSHVQEDMSASGNGSDDEADGFEDALEYVA